MLAGVVDVDDLNGAGVLLLRASPDPSYAFTEHGGAISAVQTPVPGLVVDPVAAIAN